MKSLIVMLAIIILTISPGSGPCYGMTAEALKELMDRKEKYTLVDVRSNDAYKQGHIPGAINIPARLIPMRRLPELGRVIAYGSGLDDGPAVEAVEALNQKPGIAAELLEGGLSRWEALSFLSTRKKGLAKDKSHYISYQSLEAIARSNPNVVLLDLRATEDQPVVQSQAGESRAKGDGKANALTNLERKYPKARVIRSSSKNRALHKNAIKDRTAGVGVGKRDHSDLYVLIDNGDGHAEVVAKRLKAAGIKRFVILAGGEETLRRQGRSETRTSIKGTADE